jgi:mannosyl-3-phosphoglycerate phosphatase
MNPRPPDLVVFTDLDGTLLDAHTFAYDAARAALDALTAHGVPLVLCTSKTRAEVEPLARTLAPGSPFIVENGGAICWPAGDHYEEAPRGLPRQTLVAALDELARETGAVVRSFASLTPDEVARATGLDRAAAERALTRRYDEPFLASLDDAARIAAAAARRGLLVLRGSRFHHLTGPGGKGRAVTEVVAAWAGPRGRPASVGLGDAPNDASMLAAVDRPIIVPRPAGLPDADLVRALPHAEVAPAPGPAGWNAAVLAVLAGARLPTVETRAP